MTTLQTSVALRWASASRDVGRDVYAARIALMRNPRSESVHRDTICDTELMSLGLGTSVSDRFASPLFPMTIQG
jgi:hypothetical protein